MDKIPSKALLFLVVFFANACASGKEGRIYGQDVVEKLIWTQLYDMEPGSAPETEWIETHSFSMWGIDEDGFTYAGWKELLACDVGCVRPFEETSYAHELMHQRTFFLTGDVDALHYRGDWQLADVVAAQFLGDHHVECKTDDGCPWASTCNEQKHWCVDTASTRPVYHD